MTTRTIDNPNCLEAAINLHERGLPITLCGDKNPIHDAWQHKQWTAEEIGAAFADHPRLKVGVQLGPRSGIIDIECDGPDAEQDFASLFDDCDVPITPTYKSRRGKHRLFRYHTDFERVGKAAFKWRGVEVRTGAGEKGAHSLVPPSPNTDGSPRRWLVTLDDCEPAELPEIVLKRLVDSQLAGGNGKAGRSSEEWQNIIGGVSGPNGRDAPGERNNSAAAYIGHLIGNATRLDEKSLSVLWETAIAWNERNAPPLGDDELQTVFQSILAAERLKRGDSANSEINYTMIPSPDLGSGDYMMEYLVERTLVAGQPCIVAGGHKTLKTSLLIDLAVSLSSARRFLGHLKVNRAAKVLFMCGESGLSTLQETARRICEAAGRDLADLDVLWSPDVPRFGSLDHHDALEAAILDNEIEVLIVDPAYLAMPGADAGNVFAQGELLGSVNTICQRNGAMLILAHHTKQNYVDPFRPGELADIAWAGFREWARQWILVSRREKYEPGSGDHRLWLNVGGSAGHQGLWGLDIIEGVYEPDIPRRWDVTLKRADEVRSDAAGQIAQERRQAEHDKVEADANRVVAALDSQPSGATLTDISTAAGISHKRTGVAIHRLQTRGIIESCSIIKTNRKKPYEGYRRAPD